MRRPLPGGRRAPALLATAALTVMSVGVATPAQADLLDPVGSVVEGILGEPVPTGWLYDSSATTMAEVRAAIGAPAMWARGYTGEGVGVALIDTGVVPVDGLTSGNVRVSLHRGATVEQVERLLDVLPPLVAQIRRAGGAEGL